MSERRQRLEDAVCIINPSAAKRKWLRRKRVKNFLDKNLPGQKFDNLSDKETTIALVASQATLHPIIIALGGDGTIADVMQGIRQSGRENEVVLGIVPLGSGNAFRKSLAIPKNVRKAVRVLGEGRPTAINLMDIEGYISGFSSIGGSALVTGAQLRHKFKGFWGHAFSALGLLNLPLWQVEADLEDGLDDRGRAFERKSLNLKILDVVVAKSNYFGYSFLIAPRAALNDDYLDITFFEMSARRYAMLLPLTFFGLTQRRLKHFKAKRLVLKGKDLPVQYHGEFLGVRDRVEVRAVPRAVQVICPSPA